MSDLSLNINIGAIDAASSVLKGVGNAISSLASGNVAGAATAIGTAVVAVGAASVKMAGDFEASMIKSQAEAGLTKQQMTDMGNAILDMAPKVGQAPKALADGLFFVESAGFAGKDALTALRLSAEMAANDMTDTATVSKGLTTAVKAFGYETSQSALVANQMTVTVSSGKMTMAQYATSIGNVVLTAHGFKNAQGEAKVSMAETNAALATLTNNGFPSAARASTALSNVLQQFDGNTDKVTKNIHKLGISFDENKFKSLDLKGQIEYLSKTMAGHEAHLQTVLGGSKSAAQGFKALAGDTSGYQSILEKLNNAQKNGGAETQAFAATQQGFNFKMQQAGAAVQVLMIKLGQHLLPVLGQIVGAVAPIINTLQSWGNGISTLITWLNKHQDVMNILKAAFLTIAIQIASIVIPAFIGFAITAIGAAIGVLIAWWPVIVAFALVTAVIYGIIEVVQHWGQIVAWLKGVWGGISSWFSGILNGVKVWFIWLWTAIHADLTKAWHAIVNAVKIGAMLLLGAIFAPIIAVVALFVWLYNHNTYFKMLIDAIVNIVKAGLAWLVAQWQGFTAWLGMLWQSIVGIATTAWNNVKDAVMLAVNIVVGLLKAGWNIAIGWLTAQWNTLSGLAQRAWNAVVGVFQRIFGPIGAALGSLWNWLSGWFGNLGKGAADAGKNFVMMLVNGIASSAGWLWNAVVNLAKGIWKALGFHSPAEEGPGADADKWMPNLVSMLSSGLIAGVPKIQAAVNAVAQPLSTLGSPAASGPVTTSQSTSGSNNNIAIHVHLDGSTGANAQKQGKDIADVVKKELAKTLRQQSIAPRYTSGGTHQ